MAEHRVKTENIPPSVAEGEDSTAKFLHTAGIRAEGNLTLQWPVAIGICEEVVASTLRM